MAEKPGTVDGDASCHCVSIGVAIGNGVKDADIGTLNNRISGVLADAMSAVEL